MSEQPHETAKASAAYFDYAAMGASRSLAKLAEKYGKSRAYVGQLERWSSEFAWQSRVKVYDAEQVKAQEEVMAEEKAKVLRTNFALMHKRVEVLDRITEKLLAYTEDEDKVWLPDVKAIGNGPGAERVDLIAFNDALFKEVREYLTDIAEETGGRIKKTQTAITLPPNLYAGITDNDDGSEP